VNGGRTPAGALSLVLGAGFWAPLAICSYLALVPNPPDSELFRISDVLTHAFAFTYLTFALRVAFPDVSALKAGALMLAYGVLIEVVQSFEPERHAELKDLLVDLGGISLGLVAAEFLAEPARRLAQRLLSAAGLA
jgi:VanZ family protein